MTTKPLGEAISATLFRPTALHLADGRKLEVPHREFLADIPGGRTAIVLQQEESYNVVDLLLVTDLEVHSPATSSSQGGDAH